MLGADIRAIADGGAAPGAVLGMNQLHAPLPAAVAQIAVVALQQREHSGTEEIRVFSELRAAA